MSEETFNYWLIGGSVFIWNDDLLQWLLIKEWRLLVLFPEPFSACLHVHMRNRKNACISVRGFSWKNPSHCQLRKWFILWYTTGAADITAAQIDAAQLAASLMHNLSGTLSTSGPENGCSSTTEVVGGASLTRTIRFMFSPTPTPTPHRVTHQWPSCNPLQGGLTEGGMRFFESTGQLVESIYYSEKKHWLFLHHWFLQFLWRWSGEQHNVICFTLWASTTNRLHSQQVEPPQSPKTSTKTCGFPRRTWLWIPNIKTRVVSQNITAKII